MKFLVAFSLLVASVSSTPIYMNPYMYYAYPNYVPSTQYRAQDMMGQYSYGFASADGIAKNEMRAMDGSVAGGYSYTSPEGKMIDIKYTAGKDGFVASGEALPKAPEMTMENKKAMEEHMKAKEEAEKKAAEPAKMDEPKPMLMTAMMPMKMEMKEAKPWMTMPWMTMPMKMEMKEAKPWMTMPWMAMPMEKKDMEMKEAKPWMPWMTMPMDKKDMEMVFTLDSEGNPMGPNPMPMAKYMTSVPMGFPMMWKKD